MLCASPCFADADRALDKAVDRYASGCSLHVAVPAQWTVEVESSKGHCRITAERPADDARCGVYDEGDENGEGKKTYCEDVQRIVVDVQPGSLRPLARQRGIDDPLKTPDEDSDPMWGDFVYSDGAWRVDASLGAYRGGRRGRTRRDAHRHARRHARDTQRRAPDRLRGTSVAQVLQEGGYCCTATTWEALVDLPHSRFARVEVQWPESEKNVVRFLRGLR